MKEVFLDKIHPTSVNGREPSEELGKEIVALRYDLILPILDGMIKEAQRQEAGDRGRGRIKLANELVELSENLFETKKIIEKLAAICRPWIEKEKQL